jgi:hypothetical protein
MSALDKFASAAAPRRDGYEYDDDAEDSYAAAAYPSAYDTQDALAALLRQASLANSGATASSRKREDQTEVDLGHFIGHEQADDELASALAADRDLSEYNSLLKMTKAHDMFKEATSKGQKLSVFAVSNDGLAGLKKGALLEMKKPTNQKATLSMIKQHAATNVVDSTMASAAYYDEDDDEGYGETFSSARAAHTLHGENGPLVTIQANPGAKHADSKVVVRHASAAAGGKPVAVAQIKRITHVPGGHTLYVIDKPLFK